MSRLIESPENPGWLIPEGWERVLGIRVEYPIGTLRLHLWRVQWNRHATAAIGAGEHAHEHPQILYYQRGGGRLHAGGEAHEVGKGSIFFIPAGCRHSFESHAGQEPALCMALDFAVAQAGPALDAQGRPLEGESAVLLSLLHTGRVRPFQLQPVDQAQLDACIAAVVEENERRELGFAAMVHSHLLRLMTLCLRATQRARGFGEHFRHTAWRHALIAERVRAHLREHATEAGLTLSSAARACGTSANQLNRILKHHTGQTFTQLLLRARLEHAAALLRSGQANCTEAAYAAGFNDSNYFSRAFRKVFGHAPSRLGSAAAL